MGELWQPVRGYEGLYEVSNLGAVRNVVTGRLKSSSPRKAGYLTLGLSKGGVAQTVDVHRLVMDAFVGPCPPGCNVNHKDGVKTNPALDNLEYVSFSQNSRHAIEAGLWKPLGNQRGRGQMNYNVGSANVNAAITEDIAEAISTRLASGERATHIANDIGVSKWLVYNIKYGRRWKHVRS